MDWYEVLQNHDAKQSSAVTSETNGYNRCIEEYILQGIEDEFNEHHNEDLDCEENLSDKNNDDLGMDKQNTLLSPELFVQLPNNESVLDP